MRLTKFFMITTSLEDEGDEDQEHDEPDQVRTQLYNIADVDMSLKCRVGVGVTEIMSINMII